MKKMERKRMAVAELECAELKLVDRIVVANVHRSYQHADDRIEMNSIELNSTSLGMEITRPTHARTFPPMQKHTSKIAALSKYRPLRTVPSREGGATMDLLVAAGNAREGLIVDARY
mmetsp:Transcript_21392/g.59488  ORF Transcript_21392/g.59488 Transcript_21392/m.59488 type:complete len:117 (+) Transcript_21392:1331-1681(+)